jgi:hypothetical protein
MQRAADDVDAIARRMKELEAERLAELERLAKLEAEEDAARAKEQR